ncbi:MAG: prephenate dehydrogenase/arogenate dehydrogenase family protein [Aquificota bacterium]|nr:prephenate dehydrogenase/arogenate dehydrogenase family protein [Aquificota bacterium]
MGGSFALALRESGFTGGVYGIDVNPKALETAKGMGIIDGGFTDYEPLRDMPLSLVVMATPVRTFREIALKLREFTGDGTVVTDLGSVKGKLVYELEDILGPRFVGGHPIAGTEKSGVENSVRGLFTGKKVIITPTERTDRDALRTVVSLWERIGGVVEFMDPYLHDRVFGAVSHLPHAVAFALIDAIERLSGEVDLFRYPGGGFKDFTRIAASDPVMWRDIFLENRENVLRAMDVYAESLSHLRDLIERGDEEGITRFLREAKRRRLSLG